jgi:hypothetical protein
MPLFGVVALTARFYCPYSFQLDVFAAAISGAPARRRQMTELLHVF